MYRACIALGTLGCVASAAAQRAGWMVDATPVVSPSRPTVEIRISAWFDHIPGVAELFEAGQFDLRATAPAFIDYYNPPGIYETPGHVRAEPTVIPGLFVAQLHSPPLILGNLANPLLVVVATWTPEDFTPRFVTLTAEPLTGIGLYKSMNGLGFTYVRDPLSDRFDVLVIGECYADCDASTGVGILDIFDFLCFQNLYAAGHAYACDCDTGTGPGLCDIFDFLCFQNAFAAGCP